MGIVSPGAAQRNARTARIGQAPGGGEHGARPQVPQT
ncbi:hypothetical protein AcdelDRAFT_4691, partial [Acidovorax delafieldii 2AN]